MLADAILDVVFAPFEWVIGLLPVSSLDFTLPAGLPAVSALLSAMIDVSAFGAALSVMLIAEGAVIAFHLIYLIYRKFPGIGPG